MFRIVGNHAIVVALGLTATVVVAAFLVSGVTPEYEAKASVILLPPGTYEGPSGVINRNPMENPTGIAVPSAALIDVALSQTFAERLSDEGLTGDYEITLNPSGSGAILNVRTISYDGPSTFDDLGLVLNALADELASIQDRANIDESTWIRAESLTSPSEATAISGSKIRVLAIALSLGLVATYLLAVAADSLYGERHPIRDRLRRRGGRHLAGSSPIVLEPGEVSTRSQDDEEGPAAHAV